MFSDFWNITRTREIKLGYYLCITKFYMQSNFSYITFMHEENFLFKLVAMPVKSCFFFRVHTFQNLIITNLQINSRQKVWILYQKVEIFGLKKVCTKCHGARTNYTWTYYKIAKVRGPGNCNNKTLLLCIGPVSM